MRREKVAWKGQKYVDHDIVSVIKPKPAAFEVAQAFKRTINPVSLVTGTERIFLKWVK